LDDDLDCQRYPEQFSELEVSISSGNVTLPRRIYVVFLTPGKSIMQSLVSFEHNLENSGRVGGAARRYVISSLSEESWNRRDMTPKGSDEGMSLRINFFIHTSLFLN
jgi:hypothetical protein